MWDVATCQVKNADEVNAYLFKGYEPFAITSDYGYDRIWFKRELTTAEVEIKNEIHNKPTRNKRKQSPRSPVQ